MENPESINNSNNRIKICLQDYSNDFMALDITLSAKGIDGVRRLIKDGYKVSTVEEYLQKYKDEGRETVSIEDQVNPLFIKKSQKLNKLVNRVNLLGEKITKIDILDIIIKVKKIIYF